MHDVGLLPLEEDICHASVDGRNALALLASKLVTLCGRNHLEGYLRLKRAKERRRKKKKRWGGAMTYKHAVTYKCKSMFQMMTTSNDSSLVTRRCLGNPVRNDTRLFVAVCLLALIATVLSSDRIILLVREDERCADYLKHLPDPILPAFPASNLLSSRAGIQGMPVQNWQAHRPRSFAVAFWSNCAVEAYCVD